MGCNDSVGRLPDDELLSALSALALEKRRNDVAMLAHIGEVDSRRLFAREGYSSMFEYCVEVLRLSEGATAKRVRVARLGRRYPMIMAMIARGELHLAGVSMLGTHLTEENHRSVLERARGLTCKRIERLVAELAPRPDVVGSIRKLPGGRAKAPASRPPAQMRPERQPQSQSQSQSQPLLENCTSQQAARTASSMIIEVNADQGAGCSCGSSAADSPGRGQVDGCGPGRMAGAMRGKAIEVLAPERYLVKATLGEEGRAKLDWATDLLRHRIPDGDIAVILERALEAVIEKVEKERFARTDRPGKARALKDGSRAVPAPVRRQVVARDGYRCAYVAASGRRCTATALLEFHHIDPHGRGGLPTIENVCLRCRAHNQYAAEVDYGRARMQQAREQRGGSGARESQVAYRIRRERTAQLAAARQAAGVSWAARRQCVGANAAAGRAVPAASMRTGPWFRQHSVFR